MARKKIDPQKIVRVYVRGFPRNIHVQRVVLFGSFARGDARADSDLDLIVVSPDFKGMNFMRRLELLSRLRSGDAVNVPMDIIGYTPEEFATIDKESIIMRQAKKEGKVIYAV